MENNTNKTSLLQDMKNGVSSVTSLKQVGSIFTSYKYKMLGENKDIADERIKVCKGCPLFTAQGYCNPKMKIQHETTKKDVGGCGCYLPVKVTNPIEQCPAEKWKAVPGKMYKHNPNNKTLNLKLLNKNGDVQDNVVQYFTFELGYMFPNYLNQESYNHVINNQIRGLYQGNVPQKTVIEFHNAGTRRYDETLHALVNCKVEDNKYEYFNYTTSLQVNDLMLNGKFKGKYLMILTVPNAFIIDLTKPNVMSFISQYINRNTLFKIYV